jgi:ATP-dependent Clp protease ATP-binding subunit ClpA
MRSNALRSRRNAPPNNEPDELTLRLCEILVGQANAIETIVPYVHMHTAGLAPEGRPIGVFLLLGPTGTGKTRTIEALAEVLHGSSKNLLKIDCGEFQMEHEVAKLVGAPPGYLGHRETQPMLTQAKINAAASESSPISLILFDEIEKAAPSLVKLLLGILDKATLRLGDNSNVNFENTMIFLTSNLGAKSIQRATRPDFGFEAMVKRDAPIAPEKLQSIGMAAVKQKFSPEFVNRIDSVVTYHPLTREDCGEILDQIMQNFARLIYQRLGARSFRISYTPSGKNLLLDHGTSPEFGARELKRTVQRNFMQPLSALVAKGDIPPGCTVVLDGKGGDFRLFLKE